MKQFLKVYFWTYIVVWGFILELYYLTGGEFSPITDYNCDDFYPLFYVWSIPGIISLLASVLAWATTPGIQLINREKTYTYLCITGICFLLGTIVSYHWVFRENFTRTLTPISFFLLLPVGILAGILIILLKNAYSFVQDSMQISGIRVKITAMFYFCTLFISWCFLVGGNLLPMLRIDRVCIEEYLVEGSFYFMILVFLQAIIGFFYLWIRKKSKIFGVLLTFPINSILLLLGVGFALLGTDKFPETSLIYRFHYNSYDYEEMEDDSIDFFTEEEIEEIEEEIKEEIEKEPEKTIIVIKEYPKDMKTFSFEFLWDDPQDNRDSLTTAAHYFNKEVYLTEAWATLTEIQDPDFFSIRYRHGREAYLTIAKFLYDYRTRVNLTSIAESYIGMLPGLISYELYENRGIKKTIRQLLIAHDDIVDGTKNYNRFAEIGKVMDENSKIYIQNESYQEEEIRYFEAIAAITNLADYTDEFLDYQGIEYQRATWAYSFWARRYKEGIHKDVYTILKEIQKVYGDS